MLSSLGIDIIETGRIRDALRRRPGLTARLFTAGERAYCDRKSDPAPHYAARFAAKEAVAKALGTGIGDVQWVEIEISSNERRMPEVKLHGAAAKLAAELGLAHWSLSLSHTHDHAIAFVVAMG